VREVKDPLPELSIRKERGFLLAFDFGGIESLLHHIFVAAAE